MLAENTRSPKKPKPTAKLPATARDKARDHRLTGERTVERVAELNRANCSLRSTACCFFGLKVNVTTSTLTQAMRVRAQSNMTSYMTLTVNFIILATIIHPVQTLCGPGMYQKTKRNECQMCKPGFFQPSANSTLQCEKCATRTVTTCPMSSSCSPCPIGFASNEARTECIFHTQKLAVDMWYESETNLLCYHISNTTVENDGLRIFFMEKSLLHGIIGMDSTNYFDIDRHSCTVTKHISHEQEEHTSFASGIVVNCTSTSVKACVISNKPFRKVVASTSIKAFKRVEDQKFMSDQEWKTNAWTVDHDCDGLAYNDDTNRDPNLWKCVACPNFASCQSGNWQEVTALFGYTRLSLKDACANEQGCQDFTQKRDVFEECQNVHACLGAKNPEYELQFPEAAMNYVESCNEDQGFRNFSRGCRACLQNYFPTGNGCTKCPSPLLNITTTLFATVIFIFFLSFFLKKSLADSERLSTKIDTTYSNLAQSMEKIMIAHAQILGVMASFPLRWPEYLAQFFWLFSLFSNPAAYLFNPDCYGIVSDSSLFMLKQLLVLCLPFLLVVPLTLFWVATAKYNSKCVSRTANKKKNVVVQQSILEDGRRSEGNDAVGRKTKTLEESTQASTLDATLDATQASAGSSLSNTAFSGSTHLDRERLQMFFEKADTHNHGSLSRTQFTRIILSHGDFFGHDWKPKDIKRVFEMQRAVKVETEHRNRHDLTLDVFIAGVVSHMHLKHEQAAKLHHAQGNVDMVEHHDKSIPKEDWITYGDKWINTLISMLYMLYPSLCTSCFSLVGCHSVGKVNQYLQRDMEFQCWTPTHVIWVVLVFVPSFLGFVVGLPLVSIWILRRKRALLHTNKRVKFQLSILCVGYRPDMEHWESIVSLRKGFVIGISVFLFSTGPKLQTLAAQLLIGLLLVLHTHNQPYVKVASRHDPLNHGELFGLVSAFITLTCGMYLFHYGNSSTGQFKVTVSIIVILVNVMFFIVTVRWYTMIYLVDLEMELDRSKHKNIGNSYFAFCLQHFLPDWREESQKDSIRSASHHKIRVAQMMSISRLSRIRNFARRWTVRARKSLESKKVEAIERDSDISRVAFQAKLMSKLKKSHTRVQMRIMERTASHAKVQHHTVVSDTDTDTDTSTSNT